MTGRFSGVLIEKVVFGVEIDGDIKVEFEFETGETVVVVSVSKKDSQGLEFEVNYFCSEVIGIISRIDNKAVGGVLVPDKIAVGLKFADTKGFYFHYSILPESISTHNL